MAWSCRSHSPPWSQIGQSSGWLISRNSITPRRPLRTIGRVGEDLHAVGDRIGAGGDGLRRLLHLDQAHPAIAGDRQAFVVAEARDFLAGGLAGLQHGRAVRDLDLDAVDRDLRHRGYSAAIGSVGSRGASRLVRGDAFFHHRPEMPDQPLHRPRRRIAERADRVALDLPGHLFAACRSRRPRRGPRPCGPSPASPSPCLRGMACTGRSSRACRIGQPRDRLDESVDLSITITPAVPRPDFARAARRNPSARRRRRSSGSSAPRSRPGSPPAGCPSRRARRRHAARSAPAAGCTSPPRHCTACSRGPEMQKILVPVFFGRPKPANHAAPRRRMVGATAMVSTLLTVVGQP